MRIVLVLFFFFISAVTASAVELRTAGHDSAPKYIIDQNGTITAGVCFDILTAVKVVDPEIKFVGANEVLPFKRLEKMLDDGELDIFFGFLRNKTREEKYQFVEVPLYTVKHVAAALKEDKILITGFDDFRRLGKNGRILTMAGAATGKYLEQQGGMEVMPMGQSMDHLIRLLLFKRGRFIYYHNLGLVYTVKEQKLTNKLRILPASFYDYHHWAACSKQTPKSTIIRVEAAIRRLIDDGTVQKIYDNYLSIQE